MTAAIRVANAPCSWGVLEFDLDGEAAGWRRVLSEMVEAGYAGTELGDRGFLPTEPAALREALAEHGLPVLAAFVPVALAREEAHADGVDRALRTARLLAAVEPTALIVLADDNGTDAQRTEHAGRIRPDQGLSDAAWDVFARGAEAVARAVREEAGLSTVFHHHCAGFVETSAEVAALLSRTDPDLLGLCLDTGHWAYGGGDPPEGLREHRERVGHVHFKDCHPGIAAEAREAGWDYFEAVRRGVFCELGRGAVDFPAVRAELLAMGYAGCVVVEQDVLPGLGTPLESARRSREYLRGIGL